MHSSDSILMLALDKMLENGCRYCCVCLRMENEKDLIEPKAFKAFISALNKNNIEFTWFTRVCVICEGKAKAALRFLKAAHLAVSIQELYTDMLKDKLYRREVMEHLSKMHIKEHFKELDQVEEQLQSWRAHTELVFTDILMVENADTSSQHVPPQDICSPLHLDPIEREKRRKTVKKTLDSDIQGNISVSSGLVEDNAEILMDDVEAIGHGRAKKRNYRGSNISSDILNPKKLPKRVKTKRNGDSFYRSNLPKTHNKCAVHKNPTCPKFLTRNVASATNDIRNDKKPERSIIDDLHYSSRRNNINAVSNKKILPCENSKMPEIDQFIANHIPIAMDTAMDQSMLERSQSIQDIQVKTKIYKAIEYLNSTDKSAALLDSTPTLLSRPDHMVHIPLWPVRVTAGTFQETEETTIRITEIKSISEQMQEADDLPREEGSLKDQDMMVLVPPELVNQSKLKPDVEEWEDRKPMNLEFAMEPNNDVGVESNSALPSSEGGAITIADILQSSEETTLVDLCYLD